MVPLRLFFLLTLVLLIQCQNQYTSPPSSFQPIPQGIQQFQEGYPVPNVVFFGPVKLQVEQHVPGTSFTYPSVPFYVSNNHEFSGELTFVWDLKGDFTKPGVYPIEWKIFNNGHHISTTKPFYLTVTDIDECSRPDLNECKPDESICHNTNGSYYCQCLNGFRPVSSILEENRACQDIDECFERTHNCSADAICVNTRGGFYCLCKPGYEHRGNLCVDIDECVDPRLNECHKEGATCINHPYKPDLQIGYTCRCKEEEGWVGDGKNCFPKTTCPSNHNCPPNSFCKPSFAHPQRYECVCHPGYRLIHTPSGAQCIDIDECVENLHTCKHPTRCENVPGSFECKCKPDFAPTGDGKCTNVACRYSRCFLDNEVCVPVDNEPSRSYECVCPNNFVREQGGCRPNFEILQLPPATIKQCEGVNLNVPSVKIGDDMKLSLSGPAYMSGLYVKNMSPPNSPEIITIRLESLNGTVWKSFPHYINVQNLDECSVQEYQWTEDPVKLKDPAAEYFHPHCRPNCEKVCLPNSPNCASCEDTLGSYRCKCRDQFRLERGFDGVERCVDNVAPVIIPPDSFEDTICFDCPEFFRTKDTPDLPTCEMYKDRFALLKCTVKDNIDPIHSDCTKTCQQIGSDEPRDGIIHRNFVITWNAKDSSGNYARPATTHVHLKVVDLRNTVEELQKLSKMNTTIGRVEREHQALSKYGTIIISLLIGMLIVLFFVYGRRAVNMFAYLLGAGMSYPAFEEGGTLWLSISRWWWTENERRQFLLTQWALKRE